MNAYPKRAYYTCNPGGPGHGYIKRLFVDRHFEKGENPADYRFIQALVTDNHALMAAQPEYARQLDVLPPHLRDAWRDGKWDLYEGQFFQEFVDDPAHYEDRRHTHVIAPFAIPRGWTVGRSFDWGYDKPFSCGWWAMDYEGRMYRILEWYGCTDQPNHGLHLTPDEVFERIAQMEREHPLLQGRRIEGVADPALWNAQTGESFAQCAARHGVYFRKADNHRITGWMQCHYRLLFNEEGLPGLYVFSICRDFIRTIPILCYDPRKPEDLDTTQEDHIADEWRYFMMTRPITPKLPEEPVIPPVDPLGR